MLKHKGTQVIKTNRLILRKFIAKDSQAAFDKWTSSLENSRFVMKCSHVKLQETEQMLEEWIKNYNNINYYMWAIVLGDELIGYICGNEINDDVKSVCIGYCITKSF